MKKKEPDAEGFVLEVSHLEFGYDRPLLSIDQFAMSAGERMAVLGPSGCGKTTFRAHKKAPRWCVEALLQQRLRAGCALVALDLSANGLTRLPAEIANLVNLQTLNVVL